MSRRTIRAIVATVTLLAAAASPARLIERRPAGSDVPRLVPLTTPDKMASLALPITRDAGFARAPRESAIVPAERPIGGWLADSGNSGSLADCWQWGAVALTIVALVRRRTASMLR